MLKFSYLLLTSAFILSGCATDHASMKRFNSQKWAKTNRDDLVVINAVAYDPITSTTSNDSTASSFFIDGLSEQAQRSYINALRNFSENMATFQQAITYKVPKDKIDSPSIFITKKDNASFTKTISITTMKNLPICFSKLDCTYDRSDRIASLELNLAPAEEGFTFTNWKNISTEYLKEDLGTVSETSEATTGATISPDFSGTLVGTGSFNASNTDTTQRDYSLSTQYISQSMMMTPTKYSYLQKGVQGKDIEGVVTLDATISLDGNHTSNINLTQFSDLSSNKTPTFTIQRTKMPDMSKFSNKSSLQLKVNGTYIYRHVKAGANSILEGDDDVVLYKGEYTVPSLTPLLTYLDLDTVSHYYELEVDKQDVRLEVNSGTEVYTLKFETEAKAIKFLTWLRQNKASELKVKGDDKEWAVKLAARNLADADLLNISLIERQNGLPRTN